MTSLFSLKNAVLITAFFSGLTMLAQESPGLYESNTPTGYGQYRAGSQNDGGYRRGFEDGLRSGQSDVERGKRGDPTKSEKYEETPGYDSSYGDKDQWKQQYRQGYQAGYQRATYGEGDGAYSQRPYGQNGYGRPQYSDDGGYRRGFEDGMQSGRTDVERGKRGDPTKSEKYEETPGYDSSYGDKDQWKQQYRRGYQAGYQRETYGEGNGAYSQRPNGQNGYVRPQYSDDGAYRRGFEDGMRSGQTDVERGRRGDPTKSEKFGDTPGYDSSYGDKDQWKQQYRQGYLTGYERATNGEGRGSAPRP